MKVYCLITVYHSFAKSHVIFRPIKMWWHCVNFHQCQSADACTVLTYTKNIVWLWTSLASIGDPDRYTRPPHCFQVLVKMACNNHRFHKFTFSCNNQFLQNSHQEHLDLCCHWNVAYTPNIFSVISILVILSHMPEISCCFKQFLYGLRYGAAC